MKKKYIVCVEDVQEVYEAHSLNEAVEMVHNDISVQEQASEPDEVFEVFENE